MKKPSLLRLPVLCAALLCHSASADTFTLDQVSDVVAPSTRGSANTTWFGWETFNDPGFDNVPIDDDTPDIGTTTTGVRFRTTNGEDHISSSRNFYNGPGTTLAEEVTVVTDGVPGTGFTTIIVQTTTAFGNLPAPVGFSSINGVEPVVVQGVNNVGEGQVWALWKIPGNQATYIFNITGPPGQSGYSFDRVVVDTHWSAADDPVDVMRTTTPALAFTLDQGTDLIVPSTRGNVRTTWFGWDTFNEPGFDNVPIDDDTPDIGTTATGARFRTTNEEDHISSSRNFYNGSGTVSEEVTVPTSGVPGSTGFTTIMAQGITLFGGFPAQLSFSSIAGVEPVVAQVTNAAGKGQVWAKWVIPGNAESYTFLMTGPDGQSGFSLDKFVVDTVWSYTAPQPDVVNGVTPPVAHVMSQAVNAVEPSSRGLLNTTWFGWETFNDPDTRNVPIDDSTPDIGNAVPGARFRTTNGEVHALATGNLYFFSGTLAEEITVPTSGTPGSGFTTVVLQIVSASGFGGFAGPITVGEIEGVAPVVVQSVNGASTGQFWAMWHIPGNAESYTISISGPPNQAHFSFDRVVVDTWWSRNGFLGDTMALLPPQIITASSLPVAGLGLPYSAQLEGSGGHSPYTFSLESGALPSGLALGADGEISGTADTLGSATFTVGIEDVNGLTGSKEFTIEVLSPPAITTAAALPTGLTGAAYSVTLEAAGGTAPLEWSVSAGALPDGLALSTEGGLSGTPTTGGDFTFTVQVEDANGLTATREFTLTLFSLSIASTSPLPAGVVKIPYSEQLAGTGGMEPYEWAVSAGALPAGITLSATGLLSGTPTASGDFTFTVTLTDDDDFAVAKEFTLSVTDKPQRPSIPAFSFEVATIGADFAHTLSALDYPKAFAATGLPPGLKLNAATGVIAGRPSLSGVFNVQVRASNAAGTSPWLTVPLIVRALDKNLVGSFSGLVERDAAANQNLGARVELTTTTKGTYTVKVTTGAKAASAKGFLAASAPQVSVPVNGGQLELSINAATGEISGTHGGVSVSGWRSTWNALANPADTREGYYSFALDLKTPTTDAAIPQGSGFATFTVNLAGALKIVGRSADGAAFTSTSILGPQGEIALYAPMPKNAGSLHGWLELSEDAQGWFLGNTVSGEPTWVRLAAAKSRVYGAGFPEQDLVAEGGYLGASSKGVALGVPEAGAVQLSFTGAGLDSYGTDPDTGAFSFSDDNKVLPPPAAQNATKLALKFAKGTGAVSGGFVLGKTKVPFFGQVVRLADGGIKAAGHFLLPQLPVGAEKPNATPILSGQFLITQ